MRDDAAQRPERPLPDTPGEVAEPADAPGGAAQARGTFWRTFGIPRVSACRRMSGGQFEQYCAALLRANGFRGVTVTRASGDYGIDILAKKRGERYAVQCKCYTSAVGNRAVQEAYSGAAYYDAQVPVVMTNQSFTRAAVQTADRLGVALWDGAKLAALRRSCAPWPVRLGRAALRALFGRPAAAAATLLTAAAAGWLYASGMLPRFGPAATVCGAVLCWLALQIVFLLLGAALRRR